MADDFGAERDIEFQALLRDGRDLPFLWLLAFDCHTLPVFSCKKTFDWLDQANWLVGDCASLKFGEVNLLRSILRLRDLSNAVKKKIVMNSESASPVLQESGQDEPPAMKESLDSTLKEHFWVPKECLIVGMSHTNAVSAALEGAVADRVNVINTRLHNELYAQSLKNQTSDMSDFMGAKHVFSMFGGNFHNIFGLIENPQRFDFVYPGISEIDTETRTLVHYDMIREYFVQNMGQMLRGIALLHSKTGFPIYHICSPPPAFGEERIRMNPKSFGEHLHLGISPAYLRMKFYRLHTDIVKDHCEAIGVNFIDVPARAIDKDGFLLPDYCQNDPTHANRAYGALVLQQVLEVAE
ncbi:hypothetical protein [Rhizobium giardinii]|uniref:hypothetical protein n=1 Tax=Rhizobium giardinii TaxID=56731 RepID=UPI0039E17604